MTCKTEFDHIYKWSGIDDVSIGWCKKCGKEAFLTCAAIEMAKMDLVSVI